MTNRYRAGIVGLGFIGAGDQVSGDALGQRVANLDGTHAAALSGHARVELVAGSSRDPGRRERFAARTGCRTHAEWRELLAGERLDIVSVATYAPQHAPVTIACAEAGVKAVYVEKPIATTVADARRMVEACRANGCLLVVNHNRRFNPVYHQLGAALAGGLIGDLTSASLRWGHGRLGNVGSHLIDALCLIAGAEVSAVSATLDLAGRPDCRGDAFTDPGGWGLVRLTSGLVATVDAADWAEGDMHIIVYGREGRAVTGRGGATIHRWDGGEEVWSPPALGTSMDRAVAEIVACLDRADTSHPTAMAAVRVLEAITAFHLSHQRQGAWVALPLTGEQQALEVKSG